jgi:hypothetical protein
MRPPPVSLRSLDRASGAAYEVLGRGRRDAGPGWPSLACRTAMP